MARPSIVKINPFDADEDYEVSIIWTGSRAHGNRIIISDYEDDKAEPIEFTVSSFDLKNTIPKRRLTNGKKYIIQAQVYDEENIPSALSNKVIFYTFKRPEFYFEDLSDNTVIENSSFTATIHYRSEDWEDISKYVFYLYDASKKQLLQSNEMTDSFDISYTYKGLENNTDYYIRCAGVTVNGMELDTGYKKVTIKYENPNTYARIYATPLPSQGCIQLSTNLIIVQYNGTDNFEYADSMIDLRDKTLYYNEGFLIKDDFTLIIRGVNLWQNADIFKMCNQNMGLTLSSHIYTDGTLRFRLIAPNGIGNYLLYSEPLIFNNDDMVTIELRRKNNIYQIKVFVTDNNSVIGGE